VLLLFVLPGPLLPESDGTCTALHAMIARARHAKANTTFKLKFLLISHSP
jgi:hypothetical protein